MINLRNISLARGANVLASGISLDIYPNQTIGIIGANGCGKSTLFAMVKGELEPAAGEIQRQKNISINSLEQEESAQDLRALDFVLSGDPALYSILCTLSQAEESGDYEVLGECHQRLADCDGYSAQAQASKILAGLGFSEEAQNYPVDHFSGGWRMRLGLAKCLFTTSDILLLDEPTNHLDMEAIIWLERFLKHYHGAILLVSHDRDFLDNTVSHIFHIENKTGKLYTGNYSAFEKQRAQAILLQNAEHRKQQAKIAHMMRFVERFRYKATKAKQAQSRLKAIEKLDLVASVVEQSPFEFTFAEPPNMPNPMVSLSQAALGYDAIPVLEKVNISVMPGERIGLLGLNGAGKSTLIKSMVGELATQAGTITIASATQIGYFAQHQVDQLPLDSSPLEHLRKLAPQTREKDLVQFLGGFNFSRDKAMMSLGSYSGGEKARVALAMIIWQKPNLLLLDEPTNHLDLEMRSALMFALQDFTGAMILVSHDRHALRTLVDDLWLIRDGSLSRYRGSIEDYQREQ